MGAGITPQALPTQVRGGGERCAAAPLTPAVLQVKALRSQQSTRCPLNPPAAQTAVPLSTAPGLSIGWPWPVRPACPRAVPPFVYIKHSRSVGGVFGTRVCGVKGQIGSNWAVWNPVPLQNALSPAACFHWLYPCCLPGWSVRMQKQSSPALGDGEGHAGKRPCRRILSGAEEVEG